MIRRGLLALGGVCGVLGLLWATLPRPPLREGVGASQAVFDRGGHLLRLTLAPDEKYRVWIPLAKMSPVLVEATLLHEDRHFRQHLGVNPGALLRAVWVTYVRGGHRMGGSTLTMQLARVRYGLDSRSLLGKLRQMARALELERAYSKDELLEAYLNLVPYGGNVEGAGAASLVYFGKEVDRLSLPEALTLAVIPQSPLRRGPEGKEKSLTEARLRLFAEWLTVHPGDARRRGEVVTPVSFRPLSKLPFLAPHFVQSVVQAHPAGGALRTTLDLSLQRLTERQLTRYVEQKVPLGLRNAAAIVVDTRTLGVRALVGSANFFDAAISGQVNGVQAKRSPGSTLKPFIYGLAFDQGILQPRTMVKDTPQSFSGYVPENFDEDFAGPLAAEDALVKSRNVPAVWTASQLHAPTLYDFLRKAGIAGLREERHYGLALVLGGSELTLAELAELYAMLANGGLLQKLRTVPDEVPGADVPLLTPEASFMVLDALAKAPRPAQSFQSRWVRDAVPISWKTGTSAGHRDAWTLGVVGPYVVGVWVGNFDGTPNPLFVGHDAAAPLFFELADALRGADPEVQGWTRTPPKGLSKISVCAVSGQLPGPHCKRHVQTWFIPGTSPIRPCDVHREVLVDERTGLRACHPGASTHAEVAEFWPSDLLSLFRKAGIPRRVPPPLAPGCGLDQSSTEGLPPHITSPQEGVEYDVRSLPGADPSVLLAAVTDADARQVFWFVNEELVGSARSGEPLPWHSRPGHFVVRAVDDHGRADVRSIRVKLVP